MIRVAFLDQTGNSKGGAEEALLVLLNHLPADIDSLAILFEEGPFASELRGCGIRVVQVPISNSITDATRERPGMSGALALPSASLKLTSILRKNHVDVVHTNTMKAHFVGGPAARFAGIPCVMHLRDIVEGKARLATQLLSRSCATERIAITDAVNHCYRLPRTEVIYDPLDAGKFDTLPDKRVARTELGLPEGIPLIGMVGRINRWKGHDRFLRAAAKLLVQTDCHFVIVGAPIFRDADFLVELHKLTFELGIEKHVTFIPWLDDVHVIYAALDLHCNCSRQEPFGLTIVEAAAAGVPSVCFDDGGAAEAVLDGVTGSTVPAGDIDALYKAMLRYLIDPELRTQHGSAARSSVKRFDPQSHAMRVVNVIRRAAA